jgi:ATP-binding cassette subfamily F protein 3
MAAPVSSSEGSAGKTDWEKKKKEQALARKKESRLSELEKKISACEARSAEIDDLLTREEVFTDLEQITKLAKEKEQVEKELETLYDQWAELAEE